jgi:outer membrane lipoprotein-sorting protein
MNTKSLRGTAARLAVTAAALLLAAAAAAQSADKEAVDVLRQIEAKYAQVPSVSGAFTQTRDDKAFGEKTQSQATFALLKPNYFRADYAAPNSSVNLITPEYSYRYVPQLKQVERFRIRNTGTVQDLNFMLLGFGVKTEDVLRFYSVRWLTQGVPSGHHGIQLTPRDKEKAAFKYVTILVTADGRLLPAQFSMEQLDGVRLTANLDLGSLEMGKSLDEGRFRPKFPRDAEMVDIQ